MERWIVLHFILRFLIALRFPNGTPISRVIVRRYGAGPWKDVRNWEKTLQKYEKAKLDVTFLEKCVLYNLTPTFVKFKLHRKELHRCSFYKDWQKSLLDRELKEKRKKVDHLHNKLLECYTNVKNQLSYIDFNHVLYFLHNSVSRINDEISLRHAKKLFFLGGFYKPPTVDYNKCVFNFSDRPLKKREKFLLSLGLDHSFKSKFNDLEWKLPLENLVNKLSSRPCFLVNNLNSFYNDLKQLYSEITILKGKETRVDIFSKDDFLLLKNLGKDNNIIISKTDKGKGTVILNRIDYLNKVNSILQNAQLFQKEKYEDPLKHTLLLEDRLNRFLKTFLNKGHISESEYKTLYATGSRPGILYGLPKIHKQGVPVRPVLSAIKTPYYNLSKFIVPLIEKYSKNEYTLNNSMHLIDELKEIELNDRMVMVSFDIESLYTNIPVQETIDLLSEEIYENNDTIRNMSQSEFKQLLRNATGNSYFIFNNNYYKQTEGLAMGQPLSAPLANIFLCLNERKWLEDCPDDFKPIFYKRYVDDTYIIFKQKEHVQHFYDYLNNKHRNIKFTKEEEVNKQLPFLDIMIERKQREISTSVYRKETFTGVGLNFLSHVYSRYKESSFSTLFFRAWRNTTNYLDFHSEIEFLRTFFINNGYPDNIIQTAIKKFLDKLFIPKPIYDTVEKETIYIRLPYINEEICRHVNKQLRKIIAKYYPQINLKTAYINNFKIKNFMRHKDCIPPNWCSDIVYCFKCAVCSNCYIGSTNRSLAVRISEHQGISYRTKQMLARPPQSAVRDHSEVTCSKRPDTDEFSVLYKGKSSTEIRIAESLLIKSKKPSINQESSSFPLKIF